MQAKSLINLKKKIYKPHNTTTRRTNNHEEKYCTNRINPNNYRKRYRLDYFIMWITLKRNHDAQWSKNY